MSKGEMTKSEIVKLAAEVGAEAYKKEEQKDSKQRTDRRLRNTKRLLKNYMEIKTHADTAIASLKDLGAEDYDFFKNLMEGKDGVSVQSIIHSKVMSYIMLKQIDAALDSYCMLAKKPDDQRRYRVLQSMYLSEEPTPAGDIAERENIDIRTIYRDIDAACERVSACLFGSEWIDRD